MACMMTYYIKNNERRKNSLVCLLCLVRDDSVNFSFILASCDKVESFTKDTHI